MPKDTGYGPVRMSRAAKRGGRNMKPKDANKVAPDTSMNSIKRMPTADGRPPMS